MYMALKRMWLAEIRSSSSARLLLRTLLLLLTLSACSSIPISYYDATTYTQLTALKAETTLLIESFDQKPFSENEDKIEKVTLNMRKAYEYEIGKGKGKPNSDTGRQFKKIISLFNEDINDYREDGPGTFGRHYFSQASIVLGQAFDIAIATENLKNKDKQ